MSAILNKDAEVQVKSEDPIRTVLLAWLLEFGLEGSEGLHHGCDWYRSDGPRTPKLMARGFLTDGFGAASYRLTQNGLDYIERGGPDAPA